MALLSFLLPYFIPFLAILCFVYIKLLIMNRLVGIILVVTLYIPIYTDYVTGCVNSATGTFLTKNTYSMAYNYITMQGDSAAVMVDS